MLYFYSGYLQMCTNVCIYAYTNANVVGIYSRAQYTMLLYIDLGSSRVTRILANTAN